MSLKNFCRKPVVKVTPETNIVEACRLMEQNNVGSVSAEDDGKLSGILTDRGYRAPGDRRA
jgi:CBS domain-containing protein